MSTTMSEATLTIGEVAKATGMPASTIRYYERRGLLPRPQRIGGQRRYDDEALRHLAAIRVAKEAGFSLGDIKDLASVLERKVAPSEVWQRVAHEKLEEIDELIAQAEQMRETLQQGLGCGCGSLEECLVVQRQLLQIEPIGDSSRK